MSATRPMSELRTRTDEISRLCRDSGEPVFITEDGKEDLVMMRLDAYESTEARLELYRLLDEAEEGFRQGDRGLSVEAVRARLHA